MPLSPNIKLAIASVSLGQHPTHTMPQKFAAAAAAHFTGIELVYKDLVSFSESHSLSLVEGASRIKDIAAEHGLEIVSINPFKMFEGHLGVPLEERLGAVREWMRIARALGTRIIQIPSQMDPNSTGDEDIIISDLRAMADVRAEGGGNVISFAYEAVAFGVHNSLWEDSVRIVEKVDRDNFGICLDNFHVHAKLWGGRWEGSRRGRSG
jgi:sugar phosphate isomerase/epimerase